MFGRFMSSAKMPGAVDCGPLARGLDSHSVSSYSSGFDGVRTSFTSGTELSPVMAAEQLLPPSKLEIGSFVDTTFRSPLLMQSRNVPGTSADPGPAWRASLRPRVRQAKPVI